MISGSAWFLFLAVAIVVIDKTPRPRKPVVTPWTIGFWVQAYKTIPARAKTKPRVAKRRHSEWQWLRSATGGCRWNGPTSTSWGFADHTGGLGGRDSGSSSFCLSFLCPVSDDEIEPESWVDAGDNVAGDPVRCFAALSIIIEPLLVGWTPGPVLSPDMSPLHSTLASSRLASFTLNRMRKKAAKNETKEAWRWRTSALSRVEFAAWDRPFSSADWATWSILASTEARKVVWRFLWAKGWEVNLWRKLTIKLMSCSLSIHDWVRSFIALLRALVSASSCSCWVATQYVSFFILKSVMIEG